MKTISETFNYARGLSKIWDQKTPAQLLFFVTNRCNSRCGHCFYWKDLNSKIDELSLEEIEKISKSMGHIFWLFLTGGEPFLRKDLAQICQIFYKNNHPNSINIPTNGLLVDKIVKDVAEIAKSCSQAKLVIQISIDEIGEKHDQTRGVKGNFAKIIKLVAGLKLLKRKYSNLALQANIVFSHANQDRVGEIYKEIYRKFKLDNICISLVRGQPKDKTAKEVDLNKYYEVHQEIKKTKRFAQYGSIISYLITKKEEMHVPLFLDSFKREKAGVDCLAGKQSVVLYPNGDLALCELIDEKYGNLREVNYDFNKLWQGRKADKVRGKVKGCYCTQECVYTTNIFLSPKAWPKFGKYLITGKI